MYLSGVKNELELVVMSRTSVTFPGNCRIKKTTTLIILFPCQCDYVSRELMRKNQTNVSQVRRKCIQIYALWLRVKKKILQNTYVAECNYCYFCKHSCFCPLILKLLLNICIFFWVTETADRHPLYMLF